MTWQQTIRYISVGALLVALGGCSVNAVTGKSEFNLMSPAEELAIGRQQYFPTQQSQGGQYYLDPALTKYLSDIGHKLAAKSGRPDLPYEFVILNNSVPNAWALPGGKIAFNRGLLVELEDEAELAAVVGHEITHAAAGHTAARATKNKLLGAGVALLGIGLSGNEYQNLVLGGAAMGSQLVQSKYGRDAELESDYYGMQYMAQAGYDPQGAVDLQKTFVRLSQGRQSDWISGMFASHPPSQERVEKNIATAELLGKGGKTNRSQFQQRMAKLRKDQPAYAAYDKGVKALKGKNYAGALSLANKAINMQPKESIFHELKGLSLEGKKDQKGALTAYNQAVKLNDSYFSHYLNRGMLRQTMGDNKGAEVDLSNSAKLLPTAAAANALGKSSLAQGKNQQAIGYFEQSAKAGGAVGRQSRSQLEKLELPTKPAKYLPSKLSLSSKGTLLVSVGNRASISVSKPTVEILQYKGQWQRVKTVVINQDIAAGKISKTQSTGISGISPEQARNYKVRVIKVR